jgi:hypothetical protein
MDVRLAQPGAQAELEHQVLLCGQVRLEAFAMPEVAGAGMEVGTVALQLLVAPVHVAGLGQSQAAQHAQQAGLAAAVGSDDVQQLPGAQLEIDAREQAPLAAPQLQSLPSSSTAPFPSGAHGMALRAATLRWGYSRSQGSSPS